MASSVIIAYFLPNPNVDVQQVISLRDYQTLDDVDLMWQASSRDNYDLAKYLVLSGCRDYSFPAIRACVDDDHKFLTYIIERGASVEVKNDVLSQACNRGNKKIVSRMIRIGANNCDNCDNVQHSSLKRFELS